MGLDRAKSTDRAVQEGRHKRTNKIQQAQVGIEGYSVRYTVGLRKMLELLYSKQGYVERRDYQQDKEGRKDYRGPNGHRLLYCIL
jgi:hypothetical protein